MKRLFCLLLVFSMLLGVCACDGASGETYTITFDTGGGSFVNPIAKRANEDLAAPTDPTRDGYVFEGWYKDKACTKIFAFGTMPAENLTLYAKWRYVGGSTPGGGTPSDDTSDGNTPGGNTPGGTTPGGTTPGGDRGENGGELNFNGQEVRLCISANQSPECNFPAADIYTKGPDNAGTNEVFKEVLKRNAAAEDTLGIKIVYIERDLYYDAVIEDVKQIVMIGAKNSPDIYNNDLASLAYSMISGYLWNVKNAGERIKNYFDFSEDGWYEEYIKGCTFNQDKYYMFAGDYFIDMIRMINVIYVNNDILSANMDSLGKWCSSVDDFYGFVEDGFWDMDALAGMSAAVFAEGASGMFGVTERTDEVVGFAYNLSANWAFSAGSGITLYYQDKEDGYKPKVLQDITDFQRVANKFQNLQMTPGVYFQQEIRSSTECFLQGNFLFAISRLGEMESRNLRDFSASKGIVPIPKWNAREQDDYITTIHDQVEIGAILNTAQNFTAASALMQFLNEESEAVVYAYYEKGLKFKYNDDANNRKMMDLVRETTVSPFGYCIGDHCENLYTGAGRLERLYITNTKIFSTYDQWKDDYNDCMAKMIEHFKMLP